MVHDNGKQIGGVIIDHVSKYLLKADVIGIGEHAHGDTVSWNWRLAVVEHLLSRGFDVDILLENLDFYVHQRKLGPKPATSCSVGLLEDGSAQFHPFLISGSDHTTWHKNMTEQFLALPRSRVRMFGIDVQQLSFPFMRDAMRPIVRRALSRVASEWENAREKEQTDGRLRNELNARTIAHFSVNARKRTRPTKVLYFAHNEHIAKGCKNCKSKNRSRADSGYKTEGMYLIEHHGVRYVSIATFSPKLWNTWQAGPPRMRKTKLPEYFATRLKRNTVMCVAGGKKNKNERTHQESIISTDNIDMEYYTTDDFDFTLMQYSSVELGPSFCKSHQRG